MAHFPLPRANALHDIEQKRFATGDRERWKTVFCRQR